MNYRKLTEIVVDQARLREDMGDIEGLAKSIKDASLHLVETKGLMHPVVIDKDNNLIAGGRRFRAFETLSKYDIVFSSIPVTMVESLSPAMRRRLEIEENLRRKSMTWQENMFGIVDYHRLAVKEATLDKLKWTQEATSDILGVPQSSISTALTVAKVMSKNKESPLWKAGSMFEAVQLLVAAERDAAAKEQLSRINTKRTAAAGNIKLTEATVNVTVVDPINIKLPAMRKDEPLVSVSDISKFYYKGDCLSLIPEIAKTMPIHHIVCDPPFGVDTENQSSGTGKTERIAETHQVGANLELLEAFLKVGFDNIQDDGFLCMWYDLDHHEKIKDWAIKVGWRVTRWPFTWVKTSPCSNSQAQYNITKATEVCMLMRKSEKSILQVKQPKNWIACDSVKSSSHPYVKPPEVWDYLIDSVSREGQNILDPFAGEGSSLAQIFKRKRLPMGIEIDDVHIANGLNFIQERLGKKGAVEQNGLLSELPL